MTRHKIVSSGNSARGAVRPPASRVTDFRPRGVGQGGGRSTEHLPTWGDPPVRPYAGLWRFAVAWSAFMLLAALVGQWRAS